MIEQTPTRIGRRGLWGLFFLLCFLSRVALAQTVQPVIVEYDRIARGSFELVNNTLVPLNVVLETRSFTVAPDGQPRFMPLDTHIRVKLAAMSFRIPPQQTQRVFYEARAERLPAWFVIYANFTGARTPSGLKLQIELPHTVYLLQKSPLRRDDVELLSADYSPTDGRITLELRNLGGKLGRVISAEVIAAGRKRVLPGFPLMPGAQRRVVLDWQDTHPPEKVMFRFKKFAIERKLAVQRE